MSTLAQKIFPKKISLTLFRGHLDICAYLPMDLFDPALYEMSEGFLIMSVQYDNNNYY